MIEDLYIKRNDLQPKYYMQVKDGDGNVVDITGATIKTTMLSFADDSEKFKHTDGTGIALEDAANGKFSYQWQAGETDTAGKYKIEFEINPASGGKFTVPAEDVAVVYIKSDYNGA